MNAVLKSIPHLYVWVYAENIHCKRTLKASSMHGYNEKMAHKWHLFDMYLFSKESSVVTMVCLGIENYVS